MARQLYMAAEAAELVVGRDVNYISSSEVSVRCVVADRGTAKVRSV